MHSTFVLRRQRKGQKSVTGDTGASQARAVRRARAQVRDDGHVWREFRQGVPQGREENSIRIGLGRILTARLHRERHIRVADRDAEPVEDIAVTGAGYNRLSTPVTVIGSYFPHRRVSLYLLGNVSPYLNTDESWFVQGGAGAKYQFSSKFELEMLLSLFTNDYLLDNDGRASTFNLGFRVNP